MRAVTQTLEACGPDSQPSESLLKAWETIWKLYSAPSPDAEVLRRLSVVEKWIRLQDSERQKQLSPLGRR